MTELVPPSSPDSIEHRAHVAFSRESAIKGHIRALKGAWVDLARDLYEFAENEDWKVLGHSSLNAWMSDPDVDLDPRYGYILIDNYRQFVINAGVSEDELKQLNESKVQVVAPALRRGKVTPEEAVADCKTLGRDDLRERYHGKGPDRTTTYNAGGETGWAVCESCGSRYRVKTVEV